MRGTVSGSACSDLQADSMLLLSELRNSVGPDTREASLPTRSEGRDFEVTCREQLGGISLLRKDLDAVRTDFTVGCWEGLSQIAEALQNMQISQAAQNTELMKALEAERECRIDAMERLRKTIGSDQASQLSEQCKSLKFMIESARQDLSTLVDACQQRQQLLAKKFEASGQSFQLAIENERSARQELSNLVDNCQQQYQSLARKLEAVGQTSQISEQWKSVRLLVESERSVRQELSQLVDNCQQQQQSLTKRFEALEQQKAVFQKRDLAPQENVAVTEALRSVTEAAAMDRKEILSLASASAEAFKLLEVEREARQELGKTVAHERELRRLQSDKDLNKLIDQEREARLNMEQELMQALQSEREARSLLIPAIESNEQSIKELENMFQADQADSAENSPKTGRVRHVGRLKIQPRAKLLVTETEQIRVSRVE